MHAFITHESIVHGSSSSQFVAHVLAASTIDVGASSCVGASTVLADLPLPHAARATRVVSPIFRTIESYQRL